MTLRVDLAQGLGVEEHDLNLLIDDTVKRLDHVLQANEFRDAESILVEFATQISNMRYRYAADQAIKLLEATKPE